LLKIFASFLPAHLPLLHETFINPRPVSDQRKPCNNWSFHHYCHDSMARQDVPAPRRCSIIRSTVRLAESDLASSRAVRIALLRCLETTAHPLIGPLWPRLCRKHLESVQKLRQGMRVSQLAVLPASTRADCSGLHSVHAATSESRM
jgi:hypothetical protein